MCQSNILAELPSANQYVNQTHWQKLSLLFPFLSNSPFHLSLNSHWSSFLLSSFFHKTKIPLSWSQSYPCIPVFLFYCEPGTNSLNAVRSSMQTSQFISRTSKMQDLEIQERGKDDLILSGRGSLRNTIRDKHLEHSCCRSALSFPKAVQTFFPSKSSFMTHSASSSSSLTPFQHYPQPTAGNMPTAISFYAPWSKQFSHSDSGLTKERCWKMSSLHHNTIEAIQIYIQ